MIACRHGAWGKPFSPAAVTEGAPCNSVDLTCFFSMDAGVDHWGRCEESGWHAYRFATCGIAGGNPEADFPCPATVPARGSSCLLCDPFTLDYSKVKCSYQATTACGSSAIVATCQPSLGIGLFQLASDCPCGKATDAAGCALNPACRWDGADCVPA